MVSKNQAKLLLAMIKTSVDNARAVLITATALQKIIDAPDEPAKVENGDDIQTSTE